MENIILAADSIYRQTRPIQPLLASLYSREPSLDERVLIGTVLDFLVRDLSLALVCYMSKVPYKRHIDLVDWAMSLCRSYSETVHAPHVRVSEMFLNFGIETLQLKCQALKESPVAYYLM